MAMPESSYTLALVNAAVGQLIPALSMRAVVNPLASILPAVLPSAGAKALGGVIAELPRVHRAVRPLKPARAMLLPVQVGA